MKLIQLSSTALAATSQVVQLKRLPRKPASRSEPFQAKMENSPEATSGAKATTIKEFIEVVIAERLGPVRSIEDDLLEIFS